MNFHFCVLFVYYLGHKIDALYLSNIFPCCCFRRVALHPFDTNIRLHSINNNNNTLKYVMVTAFVFLCVYQLYFLVILFISILMLQLICLLLCSTKFNFEPVIGQLRGTHFTDNLFLLVSYNNKKVGIILFYWSIMGWIWARTFVIFMIFMDINFLPNIIVIQIISPIQAFEILASKLSKNVLLHFYLLFSDYLCGSNYFHKIWFKNIYFPWIF